jgi:hypothetical protein
MFILLFYAIFWLLLNDKLGGISNKAFFLNEIRTNGGSELDFLEIFPLIDLHFLSSYIVLYPPNNLFSIHLLLVITTGKHLHHLLTPIIIDHLVSTVIKLHLTNFIVIYILLCMNVIIIIYI